MKGRITKSTGSWYHVRLEDGRNVQARAKGKLRLIDRRTTNPVNIGDLVMVETEDGDSVISEVLPRNNYIIRQGTRHRTSEHILAANLDQAMIIVSIVLPRTSSGFIDRFLVTATAYHIPSVIVINKTDLYEEKEVQVMSAWKKNYENAGYQVVLTSAEKNENVDALKNILQHKITLLAGHSGVGKSTLINKIVPELKLKTEELAYYNDKGKHTTTFAEMFELPFGGFIIDTPGIKEFGILDFEAAEVSHYFPEMEKRLHDCKFNNCIHINEPNCAVIAAVERGEIAMSRYESYLSIMDELRSDEKIYN